MAWGGLKGQCGDNPHRDIDAGRPDAEGQVEDGQRARASQFSRTGGCPRVLSSHNNTRKHRMWFRMDFASSEPHGPAPWPLQHTTYSRPPAHSPQASEKPVPPCGSGLGESCLDRILKSCVFALTLEFTQTLCLCCDPGHVSTRIKMPAWIK